MSEIEKAVEFFKKIPKSMLYSAEIMKHIELAISALEKQMPKKPIFDKISDVYVCPACKNELLDSKFKNCWECGQALSWEELKCNT